MPGIARNSGTDVAGGAVTQGSSTVFVDNKPVVRVGDAIAGHGKGAHAGPVMSSGSGTIFVDGKAVCRAGDVASCGHTVSGSGTVFAG